MLCLLGARTSFLTTPTHGPEDEMASSARLARTTYGGSLTNTCASSDACKAAALAKDLAWGSAGSYTTKGCYFYDKASDSKYAGTAYYGTSSNAVEAPLTGPCTQGSQAQTWQKTIDSVALACARMHMRWTSHID